MSELQVRIDPAGRGPELTAAERAMRSGERGPAVARAMRIVVALARIRGAASLVSVESVHIDGCLYHGRAGLDFVRALVAGGGRVAVPTTLNVGSLDLLHPHLVRAGDALAGPARELMDGYAALGATPTWTCAPYQAGEGTPGHRPPMGSHVAWAESNAIVFANSVLGARTDRYGDFLDVCAALTGRAPRAGLHLDEYRRGQVVLDLTGLPAAVFASELGYLLIGHLTGRLAGSRVPVLLGLPEHPADRDTADRDAVERDVADLGTGRRDAAGPGTTGRSAARGEDALKALGAAAASSGGVALLHAVGVTPEAPTLEAALHGEPAEQTYVVTVDDLRAARAELSTATGDRLDAVSLGTPHYSIDQFAELAALLTGGPPVAPGVRAYVSTSRAVLAAAERLGHADTVRAAGFEIVVDTCTYVTPVLAPGTRVVLTDSAKWAYYAPGNLGVDVVVADRAGCVASAREGRIVHARWP